MKETLKNKPDSYEFQDIKAKFADGKPLSADQLNFLNWHQKSLSNPHMDSIIKYYLKHMHHPYSEDHTFILPNELLNKESIKSLKRRLTLLLQSKNKNVQLKFTVEHFQELMSLAYGELILYHGNQLITGAPFFQGGIPHVVYFQWGNLFGVAKYVVLPGEKAQKANVMVYFEDMADRLLNDCVDQYNHKYENELKQYQQEKLTPAPQVTPPTQKPEPTWQPPRMGLSINSNVEKDEKK